MENTNLKILTLREWLNKHKAHNKRQFTMQIGNCFWNFILCDCGEGYFKDQLKVGE